MAFLTVDVDDFDAVASKYKVAILETVLLFVSGILWAKKAAEQEKNEDKLYPRAKHMCRMFFCWIQSVAGSGSVRLAIWILWLFSKFFG